MADQSTPTNIPIPPSLLPGEAVYDQIMGRIEPELTIAGVETLKEKYKDETPEQTAVRQERYKKAREQYAVQYQAYKAGVEHQVHSYEKGVLSYLENQERSSEENALSALTASMENS